MDAAMHPADRRPVDRVPVMCQLALGHYFLHAGPDPVDVWHDSEAFASALVTLQRRYGFDGILVNLPGRDPEWRRHVRSVEQRNGRYLIRWAEGRATILPADDNPRVVLEATGRAYEASPGEVDPDHLFYVDPHELTGVTYPTKPSHDAWRWDTLRRVRAAAPDVSVHGEVFSPFSQWIELIGCANGMTALVEDAGRVHACLERLADGAVALVRGHFDAGADAVLISSAYAGAGLISRRHYETFVLPYERRIIAASKRAFPGRPVYTHTCGAIGDRLDLMAATGTDGIDTLDPPPLGTVDLADARRRLGTAVFIKGNVDPVNTVLRGSADACYRDARERIGVAGRRGYILSTACSVPPHAPPANIEAIVRAAEAAA
jgi:uroporphyrinogen-III decarboxylase